MTRTALTVVDSSCGGLLGQAADEAPCIRDDRSNWLTRAALRNAADELAMLLYEARQGLAFLFASNEISTVVGLLAAWSLQMPVSLLDPDRPADTVAHLIEAYGPEVVIGGPDAILETLGYRSLPSVEAPHAPNIHLASSGPRAPIHPNLSLLLSTSGSTGSPKLVRLSRTAVRTNARQIAEALSIEPDDVGIAHLPLHYSYGLSVLTSHLVAGAAVSLTSARVTDTQLWQRVKEDSGTHFPGVPFHYTVLDRLGIDRVVPSSVRSFTQAGGHLDLATRIQCYDSIVKRGGRFYIMYGQTEAGPRIATVESA